MTIKQLNSKLQTLVKEHNSLISHAFKTKKNDKATLMVLNQFFVQDISDLLNDFVTTVKK